MHLHIFNHVQHKAYEAGRQPYKNIQKYVTYQEPGLFKHLKHSSLHERQDKIVSFPTLSLVWPYVGASIISSSFPSLFVLLSEHTHDSSKIVILKITFGNGRLTGLEETKMIFITTANEQQVKIHTFYITIN